MTGSVSEVNYLMFVLYAGGKSIGLVTAIHGLLLNFHTKKIIWYSKTNKDAPYNIGAFWMTWQYIDVDRAPFQLNMDLIRIHLTHWDKMAAILWTIFQMHFVNENLYILMKVRSTDASNCITEVSVGSGNGLTLNTTLPDQMMNFCMRHQQASVAIMMTSSNGNIFRVTGHLCGEFTGHQWIPRTKASDAELWCFLWSASE